MGKDFIECLMKPGTQQRIVLGCHHAVDLPRVLGLVIQEHKEAHIFATHQHNYAVNMTLCVQCTCAIMDMVAN